VRKFLIGVITAAIGVMLLIAAPAAGAHNRVNWSVNVGVPSPVYPAYYGQPAYYNAPSTYYSAPPAIYTRPQPVYVQPAPIYYPPQRVYVEPVSGYGSIYDRNYEPRPHYWRNEGWSNYEYHHHYRR
jgi:hypothetical protein